MSEQEQDDWTEQERNKLRELKDLGTPRQLAEEMVRFTRLGLEPYPKPVGLCLNGEEYGKYPNLSEDKVNHVSTCYVCKTMIHCWPALQKKITRKKDGFIEKLRRLLK